jgi:hypothetical protein
MRKLLVNKESCSPIERNSPVIGSSQPSDYPWKPKSRARRKNDGLCSLIMFKKRASAYLASIAGNAVFTSCTDALRLTTIPSAFTRNIVGSETMPKFIAAGAFNPPG